jgi:ribosomal protein L2
MALKTYKPTTPAQRQLVLVDRSGLHKGKPLKALTVGKTSTGGRNNLGRIARSTSSAPSTTSPRPSSVSSTIRTAPPSSR